MAAAWFRHLIRWVISYYIRALPSSLTILAERTEGRNLNSYLQVNTGVCCARALGVIPERARTTKRPY